jgi:hypothetical protein
MAASSRTSSEEARRNGTLAAAINKKEAKKPNLKETTHFSARILKLSVSHVRSSGSLEAFLVDFKVDALRNLDGAAEPLERIHNVHPSAIAKGSL